MSEYNDLKNIGKKEYVEKESLAKHIDNSFGEISTPFVVKEIRNFPVSDVVEVVRCKDCIFCSYVSSADIYKCDRRGYYSEEVKTTDYCSYGERRSENEGLRQSERKCVEIKTCNKCDYYGRGGDCQRNLTADHLLANGIIVPPCKVGDKAYHLTGIDTRKELDLTDIFEGNVCSISKQEDGLWIFCRYNNGLTYWYKESDIGRKLFLSREEVEQALAERREK